MAKFLTTSGVTHQLEEIIKGSEGGRLLLISPYLKFSRRVKDLLEEQARLKTDIRIVYEKLTFVPRKPNGCTITSSGPVTETISMPSVT